MKRPAALRNALARLWSKDGAERLAALTSINEMTRFEMVDVRTAQPGVVVCLSDELPEVRLMALHICEYRADMGADIGMAVPTLLTMQQHADPEVRHLVRRALAYADKRLGGLLAEHVIAPELTP